MAELHQYSLRRYSKKVLARKELDGVGRGKDSSGKEYTELTVRGDKHLFSLRLDQDDTAFLISSLEGWHNYPSSGVLARINSRLLATKLHELVSNPEIEVELTKLQENATKLLKAARSTSKEGQPR